MLRRPGSGGRRVISPALAHRLRRRHGSARARGRHAGAAGLYLDLGQFYDRIALQKERRAIELLQTRYRALYREAYARLAAFARPSCPLPAQEERSRRFLRAVTCRGLYSDEPPAGAVQLVSGEELEALRTRENAVLYQNPLFPDEHGGRVSAGREALLP